MKSFSVAFLFFFVIFFVNSILLLVQKILLKNINVFTMVEIVLLYMPQFLIYTFPFATLTASSMVLGDMASTNELLAIRSLGLSNRKIYSPLIILALIMSVCTFLVADILHPYSSVIYKEKLAVLTAEMPTMEVEPNAVNTVGNIILSNGKAEGNEIYDIVLLSKNETDYNKTVLSDKGTLTIEDPVNYVYSFELENPTIFLNDVNDIKTFGYADAEEATFYLDFSEQIPSLTSTSPVNLTSRELWESIQDRDAMEKKDYDSWVERKETNFYTITRLLKEAENSQPNMENLNMRLEQCKNSDAFMGNPPHNFYGQYYKSELTKKFALSLACFFLTLVTLPLSNVRVKHGKMTGFAVAILIAVAYWYMLFAAQLVLFDTPMSPYLLIMLPDLLIGLVATVLLIIYRKAR
ncbi:MAG: LptF/LptG family permease [Spirochaetales bacterium]|nr:LptF/LptG family permease [Candidatus Physcosoma equi]